MITRPLDLVAKLRPAPRNFDALFLVNAGLVALFFSMFGSRFVLAPGLGVNFQMKQVAGARAGAARATHHITVTQAGLIFLDDGPADLRRLRDWLKVEAKKTRQPSLLVKASAGVTSGDLADIAGAAAEAGFTVLWGAEEPATLKSAGAR
ncbi:MAG: hypothetical protein EXS32_01605 [Opitutus sp.]|nr:hypothetical protein [Opitutus sp.]